MNTEDATASAPAVVEQPAMGPPPPYVPANFDAAPNPVHMQPQNWPNMYAAPTIATQPVPAVYMTQPILQQSVNVPDEMCFSILTTLFCCLYLGIPAIILSSQANSLRHSDPQAALSKARIARALNITALVIGVVGIGAVIILRVTSSTYTYYG